MKDNSNTFGGYIKGLREDYGYTMADLADEIGYSDAYISQIENNRKKGMPRIDLIKDLSEALETPFSEVLQKAGYDDLAEGQYLKEMLNGIETRNKYGIILDDTSIDSYGDSQKDFDEVELNVRAIIVHAHNEEFNIEETKHILSNFKGMLALYKQILESSAAANKKWNEIRHDIKGTKNDLENKRLFLRLETIHEVNRFIEEIRNLKI